MKKLSRIFAVIIFVVAMFSCSVTANAEEVGYKITAYDVSINVNENNTLDVVERITADFDTPKHGIYRYIPVVNHFETDNKKVTAYSKVKNVDSNTVIFDKYKEEDNYVIQLGDPDKTVVGVQNYEISYTYDMGQELTKSEDKLYYNIIGTGWDTTIDNVTFSIQMPKDFDSSRIEILTGEYGSKSSAGIEYRVENNLIVGSVNKELKAYEGVTACVSLGDGYFQKSFFSLYGGFIIMFGASVLALIIVSILWITNGRDKKIKKGQEYYPPANMNCAQMAYCYKGSLSPKDIVPLAVELANEGYIKIEDTNEKNGFKFIRLKQYNGRDEVKRVFFNGLFKRKDEVDKRELEKSFYQTVNDVSKMIVDDKKTTVFSEKSLKLRVCGWVVCVLAMLINVFVFAYTTYGTMQEAMILFDGIAMAIIGFVFSFFIRRRTPEGYKLKQQISSFKSFLEESEKDRIEQLAKENPSYVYDVLPYAYVLGVSNVWIKRFESLAVEPPSWYYSRSNVWSFLIFRQFMNSTISTACDVAVTPPSTSSSSGGGSIGSGGFSGGGFGGGGGGNW